MVAPRRGRSGHWFVPSPAVLTVPEPKGTNHEQQPGTQCHEPARAGYHGQHTPTGRGARSRPASVGTRAGHRTAVRRVNPLDELRGEIPEKDPLQRAQEIGYQDDVQWAAKQARNKTDNADRLETLRLQLEADERVQRVNNGGRSDQEIADDKRQRDDVAAEETAELEARLNILNPGRQAAVQRSQSAMDDAALLRRAKRPTPPLMTRLVAELAERDEIRRSGRRHRDIDRAQAELSRTGRY